MLDLFCCAGGAAKGYYEAGYEIVGVDNKPQPNYPYEFIQADAFSISWKGYQIIHASPPCQKYTSIGNNARTNHGIEYPDLLGLTRSFLQLSGLPYIIENVVGAPVESGIMLCGSMLGLRVRRHRYFETSHLIFAPVHCMHNNDFVTVVGGDVFRSKRNPEYTGIKCGVARHLIVPYSLQVGFQAMGIDWHMTPYELSQAIPPAYTKYVGEQMMQFV
jgi:DNA (cytosine-5)-methyltransferase 1